MCLHAQSRKEIHLVRWKNRIKLKLQYFTNNKNEAALITFSPFQADWRHRPFLSATVGDV